MSTWIHGHGDMEIETRTWKHEHGDMDRVIWTWTWMDRSDMYTLDNHGNPKFHTWNSAEFHQTSFTEFRPISLFGIPRNSFKFNVNSDGSSKLLK
jgi:hypothetical protein